MQVITLTVEERDAILNNLAEMPAKYVMGIIQLLGSKEVKKSPSEPAVDTTKTKKQGE
jgi:hypothetical protein